MVKTVLIGCGSSGRQIAEEISSSGAELVGFCDLNIDRADELGKKYGGKAFSDYREMFETLSPEAAFICTPPYCTDEIVASSVEHGISFMTETPVTRSFDKAKSILERANEKGIITAVYDRFIYSRLMKTVECFARKNQIIHARIERVTPAPTEFWKRDCELCGGILIEKGVDLVAFMSRIFGEIKNISAFASRGFVAGIADYSTDDCFSGILTYSNNALVELSLGNYGVSGEETTLTLEAKGKRLELCGDEIRVYGDSFDPGKTKKMLHAGDVIPDEYENGILVYRNDEESTPVKTFLASVESGKTERLLTYGEGLDALLSAVKISEKTVHI